MTSEVRLDPERATLAGSRIATAAEQMLHVRNTSGSRIEAANQAKPWGRDKLGDSFEKLSEDGTQRYPDLTNVLLEIWRTASQRSAQMGADVVRAARQTVSTDQQAAQDLDAIHHRLST